MFRFGIFGHMLAVASGMERREFLRCPTADDAAVPIACPDLVQRGAVGVLFPRRPGTVFEIQEGAPRTFRLALRTHDELAVVIVVVQPGHPLMTARLTSLVLPARVKFLNRHFHSSPFQIRPGWSVCNAGCLYLFRPSSNGARHWRRRTHPIQRPPPMTTPPRIRRIRVTTSPAACAGPLRSNRLGTSTGRRTAP